MTNDKKVNYLRIALMMQDISVNNQKADCIICTYERIVAKQGKFSVDDAVEIKYAIERKYKKKDK